MMMLSYTLYCYLNIGGAISLRYSCALLGADWVSENNCIKYLHSFIFFDLILLRRYCLIFEGVHYEKEKL